MSYSQINVTLSAKHKKTIAAAVESGSGAKLKLSPAEFEAGVDKILVTKQQMGRINKALDAGKGLFITLSNAQLRAMKKGGFLAAILPAILGALAPTIFNRLFPDPNSSGSGIGSYGDDDTGGGMDNLAHPSEGEGTDEDGEGIMLPGTTLAPRQGSRGQGIVPKRSRAYQYANEDMEHRPANGEGAGNRLAGRRDSYLPSAELPGRAPTARERASAVRANRAPTGAARARANIHAKISYASGRPTAPQQMKKKAMRGRGVDQVPPFLDPNSNTYKALE